MSIKQLRGSHILFHGINREHTEAVQPLNDARKSILVAGARRPSGVRAGEGSEDAPCGISTSVDNTQIRARFWDYFEYQAPLFSGF